MKRPTALHMITSSPAVHSYPAGCRRPSDLDATTPDCFTGKKVIFFAWLCIDMRQQSSRYAAAHLWRKRTSSFAVATNAERTFQSMSTHPWKHFQTLKTYSFQLRKSISIMASVGVSIMRKRQSNHILMETTSGLLINSFIVFSSRYNQQWDCRSDEQALSIKFLSLFIGLRMINW